MKSMQGVSPASDASSAVNLSHTVKRIPACGMCCRNCWSVPVSVREEDRVRPLLTADPHERRVVKADHHGSGTSSTCEKASYIGRGVDVHTTSSRYT